MCFIQSRSDLFKFITLFLKITTPCILVQHTVVKNVNKIATKPFPRISAVLGVQGANAYMC